ncbi:Craniofacial development 2 [Brachionus plicatilis]|uniref:Craniofacial development 2 n=1 Tax=Brachionus plicatilis TaxID=10195 RepID=A0A3M7S0F0_BRAPC|nr:Craniofacial development 2 [Brachionus plicatilis]
MSTKQFKLKTSSLTSVIPVSNVEITLKSAIIVSEKNFSNVLTLGLIGLTEQNTQTKTDLIDKIVRSIRLRWAGHVRRILDTLLPKIILFGDILTGKRGRGRPEREWTDCLKRIVRELQLSGLNG